MLWSAAATSRRTPLYYFFRMIDFVRKDGRHTPGKRGVVESISLRTQAYRGVKWQEIFVGLPPQPPFTTHE